MVKSECYPNGLLNSIQDTDFTFSFNTSRNKMLMPNTTRSVKHHKPLESSSLYQNLAITEGLWLSLFCLLKHKEKSLFLCLPSPPLRGFLLWEECFPVLCGLLWMCVCVLPWHRIQAWPQVPNDRPISCHDFYFPVTMTQCPQKQLKDGGVYFILQFKSTGRHGWEAKTTSACSSSSCCIYTPEGESHKCLCPASFFLLCSPGPKCREWGPL